MATKNLLRSSPLFAAETQIRKQQSARCLVEGRPATRRLGSVGDGTRFLKANLRTSISRNQAVHTQPPRGRCGPGPVAAAVLEVGPRSLRLGEGVQWASPADDVPFWERLPFREASYGAPQQVEQDPHALHVVHITAELAPVAKVGGLADVVIGLARACLARGHRVEIFLPAYECLKAEELGPVEHLRDYSSYYSGQFISINASQAKVMGVPVILLKPANNFFQGGRIYGGSYNELSAYLCFTRAALEYLQVTGSQPDVIHSHDWHTAVTGMLFWDMYWQLGLQRPRLVFTIHNADITGECRAEELDVCGLDGTAYLVEDKALDERTRGHNPERLCLMKGGIVYSNAVTTVSPTYAQETCCSGFLSATFLNHKQKYFGILNGIDTQVWDPAADVYLPANFTAEELQGKLACKVYLQRALGLAEDGEGKRTPLLAVVTRLVPQKGIHLIRHAVHRMAGLGGQLVLLGTAPEQRIQQEFLDLAAQYQQSSNIRLLITYSEGLAHIIYAAADMVAVPSMFEPCGLTQMIGMRYGAVPVVRRTGGLADTVIDVDDSRGAIKGNGFVFDGIHEDALGSALERACNYYVERQDWWESLTSYIMTSDNSWNKSAKEYVNLYNSIRG